MNESQKRLDEKRQLRIRLENISIVLLAVFSFFPVSYTHLTLPTIETV